MVGCLAVSVGFVFFCQTHSVSKAVVTIVSQLLLLVKLCYCFEVL